MEHRRQYEARMTHVQGEHPGTAYDHTDLGARGILGFLVGLAVTVLLIHGIIWGFIRTYAHFEQKPLARTSAIITPEAQTGPKGDPAVRFPAPQLQTDEVADGNKFREAMEQQLNTSGWIDEKAGVAHIPVERAIELVVQRGLPVRPQETKGQGTGVSPSKSSAGGTQPSGTQ